METIRQDRIALITGANNGIGLELTRKLLNEDWQVIALVRSDYPKNDMLIQESLKSGKLRIIYAHLTDYESLRHALNNIKAREEKIDLIFNNAGNSFAQLNFSKQGREMHYELQTIVPYIITMELKELLLKGNLKTIINTSTTAFKYLKHFDPDTLEKPTSFKKLFGPYATSKLALSLWTREIAPSLDMEDIHILSVDPGGNNTLRKGKKSGLPFYIKPIMKLFFAHPSQGASLLYEAAMNNHQELSGSYLIKGQVNKLKFTEYSQKVLEKVNSIYSQQYMKI